MRGIDEKIEFLIKRGWRRVVFLGMPDASIERAYKAEQQKDKETKARVKEIFETLKKFPSSVIIANHFKRHHIEAAMEECLFEDDLNILRKARIYYLGLRSNPEKFMTYNQEKK